MAFNESLRRTSTYFKIECLYVILYTVIFETEIGTIVNIYAVQQDTRSVLMSEFIHHVC